MTQQMLGSALLLVLGVLTATQARQTPAPLSRESAELLLLVYALEEKTRDVLSLTRELRDSLQQPVPLLRVTTPLRARTARVRVHVDALRRHVSEKKLPGEVLSYCERLLTHLDNMDGKKSLASRLERIENKHESKILSLWKGFLRDEEEKAIQRVGVSLQTGLASFAESTRRLETSPLDDLLSGAIAGFGQQMALELVDLPRRQAAFAKVDRQAEELRNAIRPMLVRELTEELSRFETGPSRSKLESEWAQLIPSIGKRQDWPAAWLSTDLGVARSRTGRPHDPFVLLDEAREWQRRPIKSNEQAKECHAVAKQCFETAEKEIPREVGVFLRYKAELFAAAGMLANRVSEYEVGTGGFLAAQTKPPFSARLAVEAWGNYKRNTPKEMWGLPGYLHQRGIAYAYEKDTKQALKFLDTYLRKERFPSQRFWFDASRIVAVLAHKTAPRDPAQATALSLLSLQCLSKALLLGKAPLEKLSAHPDFTHVRASMKPQFDELLQTRPYDQQLLSAAPTKPDTTRPPPPPAEKLPGRLLVKGSEWADLKATNGGPFDSCILRITDRDGGKLKGTLGLPMPMNKGMRLLFPVHGTLKNGEVNLHTGKPEKGESKLNLHFTGRVKGPDLHLKGKGQGHAGKEITVEFHLKHRGQ